MRDIYLIVLDLKTLKEMTWHYSTEFEKDKAKERLKKSTRYRVIGDSTDDYWIE